MLRIIPLCIIPAMAIGAMAAEAPSPSDLARLLEAEKSFGAEASFEVWLPNASDPVVYDVRLRSVDNGGADSLLGFDYLVDWTLPRPGGESRGFSAYFGGNHYRYRDGRLQEYHFADEPSPFEPGGRRDAGVQRQAQFVDLLPGALAAELRQMQADSSYSYAAGLRDSVVTIRGNRSIAGNEVKSFEYSFRAADGIPLKLDIDTNPGQISEQTMTVKYAYGDVAETVPHSEEELMALYPEEFARYRQSDFRLDKLPGQRMPEFSVQTIDGGRLTHHKADGFESPVVLAVLDSEAGNPAAVLAALRQAIELYPGTVKTLTAFIDNRLESVEGVAGHPLQGETVLYGARSLARDCGVTDTPTLIFVNADGTVSDFIRGVNKSLADEVLEMITNLN